MSFFKKLTKEFEELKTSFADKDKDKDKEKGKEEKKDQYPTEHHQEQHGEPSHNIYDQQQHGAFAQHPGAYGAPPSFPASNMPPLPPGWTAQFDQNSQRWFYVEVVTGRTQWDPPMFSPPPPPSTYSAYPPPPGGTPGYEGQKGFSDQGAPVYNGGGYDAYGAPSGGHDEHGGHDEKKPKNKEKKKEKEKGGNGKLIAAGAGGLLVGGLAVAALHDSDSDDEHGHAAAPYAPVATTGYAPAPYGAPIEPAGSISSSDAESLKEAREELREAQEKAADSDASSSDEEALEEAQEEYQEELEEAYD